MRSIPELTKSVARALIGAAALALACTASAQTATPAAPPAADKAAGPELVCKTIRPAGTRLPQRVCHTQADWDSLSEASQEDMRRVRDRSRASGARPN